LLLPLFSLVEENKEEEEEEEEPLIFAPLGVPKCAATLFKTYADLFALICLLMDF
jgi:hypothetical protein